MLLIVTLKEAFGLSFINKFYYNIYSHQSANFIIFAMKSPFVLLAIGFSFTNFPSLTS